MKLLIETKGSFITATSKALQYVPGTMFTDYAARFVTIMSLVIL